MADINYYFRRVYALINSTRVTDVMIPFFERKKEDRNRKPVIVCQGKGACLIQIRVTSINDKLFMKATAILKTNKD